jgi:hypothetical protein
MPITVSGTQITFNDATVQTTAAVAGGVTSLNGATGAITNDTFNAIGSYTVGGVVSTTLYSVGATLAGGSLQQGNFSAFQPMQSNAPGRSNQGQTGTWRAMARSQGQTFKGVTNGPPNLWVRIS